MGVGPGGKRVIGALAGASIALMVSTAPALGLEERAFEQVSPVEKDGSAIDYRTTVQSAVGGVTVAYSASGAIGGAAASTSGSYYMGRRLADRWTTEPLDAPQLNQGGQVATSSLYLSSDLTATMQYSSRALTPGANDTGDNLYLRNNIDGSRRLAVSTAAPTLSEDLVVFSDRRPVGASTDLRSFVFASRARLTPDASPGVLNVFETRDGQIKLVNRLPDGLVDAGGAWINSFTLRTRIVSADGRRIVFQSPVSGSGGPLYMRVDGRITVPVSVSRRLGDPTTPQDAYFASASEDGRYVFFTSSSPLTVDASAGSAGDLYRYDAETNELIDLSPVRDPFDSVADVAVQNVSDDGSYVYFTSRANLTGGVPTSAPKFYVAHGRELRKIAEFSSASSVISSSVTSPNGQIVGFVIGDDITGADTQGSHCAVSGCAQAYIYDAPSGTLTCASCGALDGDPRIADFGLGVLSTSISQHVPRVVLDTGQIFFETEARLAAEDVNGRRDVYQAGSGRISLISSGRSSEDSYMAEASLDGRDVFFFTSEQLVEQDSDNELDLYDARVGGGLETQNRSQDRDRTCAGDGCQGDMPLPLLLRELPSGVFRFFEEGVIFRQPVRPVIKLRAVRKSDGRSVVLTVRAVGTGVISARSTRTKYATVVVNGRRTYRWRLELTRKASLRLRRDGELWVRFGIVFGSKDGGATVRSDVGALYRYARGAR